MAETAVPNIVFTPTGFQAPTESEILAGVFADLQTAFGGNLNEALNTPQGQVASTDTAIIGQVDTSFVTLAQLMDPAYSYGRFQDAIGRIVPGQGFARNPAQPTVVQATCTGAAGVNVPVGQLVSSQDGNLYVCIEAGTIPVGGSITLTFQCTTSGPIACPANNLGPAPYTALPGLDTITNTDPGTVGNVVESRAAFELRRTGAVAANAVATLPAIRGAVLEVPNVLDVYTDENPTDEDVTKGGIEVTGSISTTTLTVSDVGGEFIILVGMTVQGDGVTAGTVIVSQTTGDPGYDGDYVVNHSQTVGGPLYIGGVPIAANSMYVAVTGGAAADVAQAIWSKKSPGCGYSGNTTVTVYDTSPPYTSPYPSYDVTYEVPENLPTAFYVQIEAGPTVPSDAAQQIQTAILGVFNGETSVARARIGQEIFTSRYYAAIASLGPWATIILMLVATTNTRSATFTGSIAGTTLTVSATQQGTLDADNFIFGEGVAAGTRIVSGSGPYVVNISQTVVSTDMSAIAVQDGFFNTTAAVQINQQPTLDAANIVVEI